MAIDLHPDLQPDDGDRHRESSSQPPRTNWAEEDSAGPAELPGSASDVEPGSGTDRFASPERNVRWHRWLLLVPGLFFLALGLLGILLPGLPTTPFLLLASYFFIRSSPRMNQALLNSRLLGPLLTDWQERGGIRQHVKMKAMSVVSVTVAASAWLSHHNTPLMLAICAAAAVGLAVIARLPTIR